MLLVGHEKQKNYLHKVWLEKQTFPVMIFHGPDGIGKKQVALHWLQGIFCNSNSACGNCIPCKKILHNEHESLKILEPDGKMIKIDQIKDLLKDLSLKNIHGARFIIIDSCEKLNPQAANSLLKTLEEPPKDTYFILITNNLNSLLPTIKSRAICIPYKPLSFEEMEPLVESLPKWMAKASQGRPSLLSFFQDSEVLEERRLAIDILKSIQITSRFEAFQKIKSWIQTKPNWDRIFFFLLSFLRDAQIYHINHDKINNLDQEPLLKELATLNEETLDQIFLHISKLQEQFLANQDKTLCLESFWLESSARYNKATQ